jgi:hypothetical protein
LGVSKYTNMLGSVVKVSWNQNMYEIGY